MSGPDPSTEPDVDLDDLAPRTIDKSGTDLPLPLRGSGGSINQPCERCPYVLLDQALTAVSAPPLDDSSRGAAYRWLAAVEEGLVFRRERRMLANAIARAISTEYHSRRHIEAVRRSIDRAATRRAALDAGTYWPSREAARRSRRPVRVDVEPAAWERFKEQVTRAGTTVGEALGCLAADRRSLSRVLGHAPGTGERRVVSSRVSIDDEPWQQFHLDARRLGVTVARALGLLTEVHASRWSGTGRVRAEP